MTRSTDTPLTTTIAGTQSPLEQANCASFSPRASSSAGSSLYSSSSSSSRQHLSSGNTSPPGTLPIPSSSTTAGEREHSSLGSGTGAEEKYLFSPAHRSILQQSWSAEQLHSSGQAFSARLQKPLTEASSGDGGDERNRKVIDSMMQSASLAASSSTAQTQHGNAYHDESRGSSLRQFLDSDKLASSSNNGQRPASKARRTSSGGSRVPSEEVGRRGGGSSASDSGSDWPHEPKAHLATPAPSTSNEVVNNDGEEPAPGGRGPERASTSSSYLSRAAAASRHNRDELERKGQGITPPPHLDLAKYPPQDLLRVLAALLAQIAAANDQLRPREDAKGRRKEQSSGQESAGLSASSSASSMASLQRMKSDGTDGSPSSLSSSHTRPTTAALSALQTPSSTLCFHARNVPSISIESYLLRILKYCPATNEVFLSLLIYFDRMSKMGAPSSTLSHSASTELASQAESVGSAKAATGGEGENGGEAESHAGMRGFAIDSYNVHRLVIAGVTVASKFFSDVFYTNSRYAKVGGLPVHELNQLELQFLLLNDFKLVIPLEEMQRYADQLLVYGGVPRSTWTDAADGPASSSPAPVPSHTTSPGPDRSAAETVVRNQGRDVPMAEA